MLSLVIFAFAVYALVVHYTSHPTLSKENERIYFHSWDYDNPFEGYVRIHDIRPGAFGDFMYPGSYNYTNSYSGDAYQRFLLIRLPSYLGGDKNDTSSFRAYSRIDIESHCIVSYNLRDFFQIVDPCHNERYRVFDGASYYFGVSMFDKPVENALPQLDLVSDNDGFLYVKPPIWTVDQNGIVGEGRHLFWEQTLATSKIILKEYNNTIKNGIKMPFNVKNGTLSLFDITHDGKKSQFHYISNNSAITTVTIDVTYCNCTKPADDLESYMLKENPQAWKFDDHLIYAAPTYYGIKDEQFYYIGFYENGYQVFIETPMHFTEGMQVALTFFNGTKLSDLEQVG